MTKGSLPAIKPNMMNIFSNSVTESTSSKTSDDDDHCMVPDLSYYHRLLVSEGCWEMLHNDNNKEWSLNKRC